jgi:hypothetical protein
MFQLHNGIPRYSDVGFAKRASEKATRLCGKRSNDFPAVDFDCFIGTGTEISATDGVMAIIFERLGYQTRVVEPGIRRETTV